MKVVVVGLGYVGLSNAVLLAQHNEVVGVDIIQDRVDAINSKKSPIVDVEISKYLASKDLNLRASSDLKASLNGADYVIVSTPTNYDENTQFFDTSSVEEVITQIIESQPNACIVVKSTIPVGFIEQVRMRFDTDSVIFSPEFLREGRALYDNLYPSRIIVGEQSERAETFARLLADSSLKPNVEILLTGAHEAEAIKLFSNTYLAMRVAFFNELDTYALAENMDSRQIIDGVSLDPRIGDHYNNPSFGYGGYCFPKDTKQLLANYAGIPQDLITAVVNSNATRKKYLVNLIVKMRPKNVGIYGLGMKAQSDNYRESAIIDIMRELKDRDIGILIYEPSFIGQKFLNTRIENDLEKFQEQCDLIIANRDHTDLAHIDGVVFTRDIYQRD